MADFYTPPQLYSDQPSVRLLVEFDHGDTGLPLIDATSHLVDLLHYGSTRTDLRSMAECQHHVGHYV